MKFNSDIAIDTITVAFSVPILEDSFKTALYSLEKFYENRKDDDDLKKIEDYFIDIQLPVDNFVAKNFYLYRITKNSLFLHRAVTALSGLNSPSLFSELFWNIAEIEFLGKGGHGTYVRPLRSRFHEISEIIKKSFAGSAFNKRQVHKGEKLRVAILSPQILGMRHSPTREAMIVALNLEEYFNCEVVIYNTNSMNYSNDLNLYRPVKANSVPDYIGRQLIPVSYMEFEGRKFKLHSFPPERMSTRKIFDIFNALREVNTDVVISHSENLFVQEVVNQMYPTLFLTTGSVVPFARSDAYWIPASLMSKEDEAIAAEFGHQNFLLESMFSSPESIAESPANRSDFGCSADSILLLCVSTRIKSEITPEFIKCMSEIVDDNPRVRLLIAGTDGFNVSDFFDEKFSSRVINLGFVSNISAVSAMCDIYVNLHRHGGGTSSQTAILSGLPVVTLNFGHISDVVPRERRHDTWIDYKYYLCRLISDDGFRKSEALMFKNFFHEFRSTRSQCARLRGYLDDIAAR